MKNLFLSVAMLSVVLFLGACCTTTKHKAAHQPAAVSPKPSAAPVATTPQRPEVVTPPAAGCLTRSACRTRSSFGEARQEEVAGR